MVYTLFVNEGIIMSSFEADGDTVSLLGLVYSESNFSEDGSPPWGDPLPLVSSSFPTTPRPEDRPSTPYERPGTPSGEAEALWDELGTPLGTPLGKRQTRSGTPSGKRQTPQDEPGTSLREGDPLRSPSRQPDTVGELDELPRQGLGEGTPPSAATTGCTLPADVCGNSECESKDPKTFHNITESTTAGGQDWTQFVGKKICNACYHRYRLNGAVKPKNRKYSRDETCQICSSKTTERWHTVGDGDESKVVCHRCYSRTSQQAQRREGR